MTTTNANKPKPELTAVSDAVLRLAALLKQPSESVEVLVILDPTALRIAVTTADKQQCRQLDSNGHWFLVRVPLDSFPQVPLELAGLNDIVGL